MLRSVRIRAFRIPSQAVSNGSVRVETGYAKTGATPTVSRTQEPTRKRNTRTKSDTSQSLDVGMVRSALQHCSPQAESHKCLWKRQVPTAPTVVRGRSSSRDERRRRADAYTRNVAWGASALVHRRRLQARRHLRPLQSPRPLPLRRLPCLRPNLLDTFGARRQVLNPNASRIATNTHPIPRPTNTMSTIAVACPHRSRGVIGPSKEISRSISDSRFTVRVMAHARLLQGLWLPLFVRSADRTLTLERMRSAFQANRQLLVVPPAF